MIETILRAFHLTAKEIRVMQKALEAGPQPASTIARLAELPRNTTRSILDGLVKKGMMIKTKRANTQYYSVERKENLIRSVQHKKLKTEEEADRQLELLQLYGDDLNVRQWAKNRPRITFYEGTAGLEKVYEDTLTSKETIRSWASFEGMHEGMPEYFETYYERRTKKGILIRSIHPDTPFAQERSRHDTEEMRESYLVSAEAYNWTPEIQIYDNKVNIASWKEKLGIIIESKEIADALGVIFELSCLGARSLSSQKQSSPKSARKPPDDQDDHQQ